MLITLTTLKCTLKLNKPFSVVVLECRCFLLKTVTFLLKKWWYAQIQCVIKLIFRVKILRLWQLWLKSTIVFTHKIICFIYPIVNITTCVIIENSVSRSSIVDEGWIYFIEFCQLMFFKIEKQIVDSWY